MVPPETWKPSSATEARSVVSNPTAGLEQVARKLRTMNSYSFFFSELQSPSPAFYLLFTAVMLALSDSGVRNSENTRKRAWGEKGRWPGSCAR